VVDADGNGVLSDDERDEDADGLSNFDEAVSSMQPDYWNACYTNEAPYPVAYAGTSPVDGDSDGDGVRDGADDQDHDDVPNLMELSRFAASGYKFNETGGVACKPLKGLQPDVPVHPNAFGQVNPFNPCLPDPDSRTCARNFTFGTMPAPFEGPHWWALN
jgi:hypothetical protein